MSSLRRLSNARHYPQICIKEAETDLSKLCKENRLHDALEAVEIMEHQIPITRNDTYSLLRLVEQEKDLECGRRVHLINLRNGLETISVLGDHIIRLFAHHGSLLEANQAFEKIAIPSAHTWAAIILANAKLGQGQVALQLFEKMQVIGKESS